MKKYEIGTLFPNNQSNVAFYSPTAFCVTLNTITESQLSQINPNKTDSLDSRRILYHEMRHNIDHLSTLWGQKKILQLCEAVNAWIGKDEKQFFRIVQYKINERQLHFNTYYTESYNSVIWRNDANNWGFEFSTGLRFDNEGNLVNNNPIIFLNFKTQNGLPINRVPLSIASLLEVNAISEEILAEQRYLNTLLKDKQKIEAIKLERKMLGNVIYDPDFAVYNCIVHLVSVTLQFTSLVEAIEIASQISTVVLNLPDSLLNIIPINSKRMEAWRDRPKDLVNNGDYGFIFFNTLHNYREIYIKENGFSLEGFLHANNLPDKETIEDLLINEFIQIKANLSKAKSLSKFFEDKASEGLKLFKLRGLDGRGSSIPDLFKKAEYIPFIVAKNTLITRQVSLNGVMKDNLDDISIDQWYHLSADLNEKMEHFFQIRGI